MKKRTIVGRIIRIITCVGNGSGFLSLSLTRATCLFMSSVSPGIEFVATVGTHLCLRSWTLFWGLPAHLLEREGVLG